MIIKKIFLISILFYCTQSMAQNNYTVSLNGIGDFKINMTKAEVEKLISKPIQLHNLIATDEWTRDTVVTVYKDIQFSLIFEKQYTDDKINDIILAEVYGNNALLKTPSGIVAGDDICRIISTYAGYSMMIYPDYENNYTVKSKTLSSLTLQSDETNHVIIFHLASNKVSGFSVTIWEGD